MPGDVPTALSDNATIAVLQATQLDHERRITENAGQTSKNRELFEARFEQMRSEIQARDHNLYRKIEEVAKESAVRLDKINDKLDEYKTETDTKLATNAQKSDEGIRGLQYWIMGAILAVALNLWGAALFLATRVPSH